MELGLLLLSRGTLAVWFTLVLISSKPAALPDSFLKTRTHLLAAKNRLGVCETESRLPLEAQAYGRSDSYQAELEARTPSALGAGTEKLAAENTAAFRSGRRGRLADAIPGRLFPGRTLQNDLELSEDGVTWDPKGCREDLDGTLGMLVKAFLSRGGGPPASCMIVSIKGRSRVTTKEATERKCEVREPSHSNKETEGRTDWGTFN